MNISSSLTVKHCESETKGLEDRVWVLGIKLEDGIRHPPELDDEGFDIDTFLSIKVGNDLKVLD